MIDPTNPRVIQDSMRAMAGQSYGLIPTLFRQLARMIGAASNPRAQTPVFDRILSQIQPQVIRGLSQQSRAAVENYVPPKIVHYEMQDIDGKTHRFSEEHVEDQIKKGIESREWINQNLQRIETPVEGAIGPEKLNVSQVDHVLRTILRGAEAMGISAERLAGIDWAGIDLDTILTGAVENGEFSIDLSRIPGIDDEMRGIFRQIRDGIDASGLQPVIQNAPLSRSQRTQASEEPARPEVVTTPAIQNIDRLINWLTGERRDPQAPPRQASDVLTQATRILSGDKTAMQPADGSRPSLGARVAGKGLQWAAKAGNAVFNRLPQFIQRPITQMGQAGGTGAAIGAGLNPAAQQAAGAAGAQFAKLSAGLFLLIKVVTLFRQAVAGVISFVLSMPAKAWATTQRVTQYSGALQAAQAISEMREMTRNYELGSIVGATGSKRIESNDAFAEAMMPLEASIAILGNALGSFGTQFAADTVGFFNSTLFAPALEYLSTIVQFLPFIAADTKENIKNGTDKIVQAIKEPVNKDGWIHPTGGPNMMAAMLADMMPGFNMGEPEKPKPFHGAAGPAVPNVLDPNRPFNPNPFGAGPFGR